MLLDVDNLSAINQAHGYGVGDRILERAGILMRSYFREHDWVARFAEDTIAVLLPETIPADAISLAERTRTMIEERLTFRDHRTEQPIVVTVSVAVASARALEGEPIDQVKWITEAEAALERAKTGGRNRVEHDELLPRLISIEEATKVLTTTAEGIEKLVSSGALNRVNSGRFVRLERAAVEAMARRLE
jgi:diguanylate cyclase (GGDEF)-like protein/excisionase family DNA binding protein